MNTRIGIGGVIALAIALNLLLTGTGFTVGPTETSASVAIPAEPEQSTSLAWGYWGAWSAWQYQAVTSKECLRGRQTQAGRENRWPQCRIAVRAKKRINNIPGPWSLGELKMESVGPFGLFWAKNFTEYRYNGSRVYTDGQTNCSSWGAGYTVDIKWCGTDNEGGRNIGYLRVGFDWKVSFLYNGFPANVQHWSRAKIYVSGARWCCRGDHEL